MALSKAQKSIIWEIVVAVVLLIATMLFLERQNIAEWMNTSAGERAIANHIATPIDLTSYSAANRPWKGVPWGFQVFDGVPFHIDRIIHLWGADNAKRGAVFPESVTGIAVNQKFEMLYVYHCAFFNSPKNTPVYDVIFRYDDGVSETNTVRYGTDVVDFHTTGGKHPKGPSGPNSRTAWIGSAYPKDGHPLLFSLSGIKNPRPYAQVATIDLFSSQNGSAGVVLAMTTGPTNLMK